MPKVELNELHLLSSPISENVYIVKLDKKRSDESLAIALHKKDVTSEFIACIIRLYRNQEVVFTGNGKEYKLVVEEIKNLENEKQSTK